MKTQIDFQLIDSHHYIQSTENSTISKNDKNYENVPQPNSSGADRDDDENNQIEVVIENPVYYPNEDEIIFQSDSANNGGPNVSQKPFLGSGSGGDGPFTPQKPFLGEPFTTGPGLLLQKII